jgi:pyruvate-formate lyase
MGDVSAAGRLVEDFGVTTFEKTPRRLSPETRAFAARVLSGEFGREMRKADFLIDRAVMPDASENARYAAVVSRIAESAPLRLVPEEKLVGAAPMLEATHHMTPGSDIHSTSHTTIDFGTVLESGYRGLRKRVEERLERGDLDEKGLDLLQGMLVCLAAAGRWQARYVVELERLIAESDGALRRHYEEVLAAARNVPENPPENFREALQSLWFMWEFQRLCGNWSGLGRMDEVLGPFLRRDLEAGSIDLDGARELIAHFWIKGCEWIGGDYGSVGTSGDAQFYQNVILGGIDAKGASVISEVTYLILDVVEELHISDFPIAVRVGAQTPERLWRRIAELQRLGGGIVSIYNEDLVLRALVNFGYPLEEARQFTNDGCWEIIVGGKTAFSYYPFDMLLCLQEGIGLGPDNLETPDCDDFEELYQAFLDSLRKMLERIWNEGAEVFANGHPAPLLSLFVADCIERGRGYHERGARYSVRSPHAGGLPDTANSLYVLKRVVFDEERFTLEEFLDILRDNWEEQELLRQRLRNEFALYGNDDDDADGMLKRVYDDYVRMCAEVPERNGVRMPAGISTFGRETQFKEHRTATPFGSFAHDILASNLSPTPGTDREGPTAVVKSICKVDFEKLPCGTPLDLKIHPSCLQDENGLNGLVALLKTFVDGGGLYLQVDVVDGQVLRAAQEHPEQYANLSVRVSGWSARFVTLSREWQEMIIQRTEQFFN